MKKYKWLLYLGLAIAFVVLAVLRFLNSSWLLGAGCALCALAWLAVMRHEKKDAAAELAGEQNAPVAPAMPPLDAQDVPPQPTPQPEAAPPVQSQPVAGPVHHVEPAVQPQPPAPQPEPAQPVIVPVWQPEPQPVAQSQPALPVPQPEAQPAQAVSQPEPAPRPVPPSPTTPMLSPEELARQVELAKQKQAADLQESLSRLHRRSETMHHGDDQNEG